MAQAPISTSQVQTEALDKLFRETFLASAPLYSAASKVKLPYEDLKTTTTLYRGSLTDEVRTVEQIADYQILNEVAIQDSAKLVEVTKDLATRAGHFVDGLIRMENGKQRDGGDVRNTGATRVVDIFEHTDGRRNLNFILVNSASEPWNPANPFKTIQGWIAYRFYFACARIRQEYKHATTKSL